MAEHVLTNALIHYEGLDLTTQLNQVAVEYSVEALDRTAFSDDTRTRVAGLKMAAISASGFYDAAEPDASLFGDVGGGDKLISVAPTTSVGDVGYFMRSLLSEYTPIEGSIGDLAGFRLAAAANIGDLIRGRIGHNGAETATGNETGVQLGAISATQLIYAGTHITAVSGTTPTLQIIVQSDDNSGFTSATDRITFSSANAIGSQFASLSGAITDDWWRIRFVIGGTSPSFTFVTFFGIQ